MGNYPMFTGTADGRSQLIRLRDLRSKGRPDQGQPANKAFRDSLYEKD